MSSQGNDNETKYTPALYCCFIRNGLEDLPSKVSLTRFNEIFHCLWKKQPWKGSEKVFAIFKDLVTKVLLNEFEALNKELNIEEKLTTLDLLYFEYSDQKNVIQWRPNGNVDETLISHSMEEKLRRKCLLESIVNKKMKEVEMLKSQLQKNCLKLKHSENIIDEAIELAQHNYSNEIKYFQCLQQMGKEDVNLVIPSSILDLKYIRSTSGNMQ